MILWTFGSSSTMPVDYSEQLIKHMLMFLGFITITQSQKLSPMLFIISSCMEYFPQAEKNEWTF